MRGQPGCIPAVAYYSSSLLASLPIVRRCGVERNAKRPPAPDELFAKELECRLFDAGLHLPCCRRGKGKDIFIIHSPVPRGLGMLLGMLQLGIGMETGS